MSATVSYQPAGMQVARLREAVRHVLDVQRRIHDEEDTLKDFDDVDKVSTMLPSGRLVQLDLDMLRRALGGVK